MHDERVEALQGALARRLAGLTPPQFNHVFFSGSGSEANDTIVRMAQGTGHGPAFLFNNITDYNKPDSISGQVFTGGQGSYHMEFSHYETVPGNIQQQIIDQHKKEVAAAHS